MVVQAFPGCAGRGETRGVLPVQVEDVRVGRCPAGGVLRAAEVIRAGHFVAPDPPAPAYRTVVLADYREQRAHDRELAQVAARPGPCEVGGPGWRVEAEDVQQPAHGGVSPGVADGIGVADMDGMNAGPGVAGVAVGLAVGVTATVAEGGGAVTGPVAVGVPELAGVAEGPAGVGVAESAGCGAFPPPVTDSPVPWVPCTMAETGRPAAYSAAVSTPRVTTAIPAAVATDRTMTLRLASFLPRARACGDTGRPVRLVRAFAAALSIPRS